jgi:hypothetical protein
VAGRVQSSSTFVSPSEGNGWGSRLAKEIDAAISDLSDGRDVISVAVSPVTRSHSVQDGASSYVMVYTSVVTITVVWREP